MATITQQMQDQVTQLYIGFFGRAPDATGFGYWTQAMSNGASQQTIANAYASSPEFTAAYGGLTATQQITKVYNNILNRGPDTNGLNFWVQALNNGVSLPTVIVSILNSAVTQGTATADGNLVLNKTSVGEYFAITLQSNNTAVAATAFNGVTSDPNTVATAQAALNVTGANQVNITTPNAGTFYGTSTGANAFIANAYTNPSTGAVAGATLVNGDQLIGSASGPNTLKADLYGTNVTNVGLTNISNYVLSNTNVTAASLSVTSAGTAANNFSVNAPVGNITVNGVSSTAPVVNLTGLGTSSTAAFTLAATSGAITAPATAKVNVTGVVNATDSAYANNQGFLTVDSQYSGLNITAVGTNFVQTGFVGANKYATGGITISGAGSLSLAGSGATSIAAPVVNASAMTGALTLTATDTVTTSITGSAGNNTIRLIDQAGGKATIALGSGTNYVMVDKLESLTSESVISTSTTGSTLALSGADALGGAGLLNRVSGFQTLALSNAGANTLTFGTNLVNAGFTAITSTGTGDAITLQSIPTAITGLTLTGVGTGGNDTLTLQTAGGTFTVSNFNVTADASTVDASTFNVNGTGTNSIGAAGANTDTINLSATAVQTLSLSGTSKFAVTGNNNTANEIIVGASTGLTGGATTITGSATGGRLTIDLTASTASNTITANGGTVNVLVNTGANLTAANAITGGAGTDTLTVKSLENGANLAVSFDNVLAKVSAFDVLALTGGSAGNTNAITLGTNFTNAGFTSVTGLASGDAVTVAGTTLNGVSFSGVTAASTGSNSLILQTAGGTFTVNNIGTVDTSNSLNSASTITLGAATGQTYINGGTAATTVTFGAGSQETLTVRTSNVLTVNAGATTNDAVILLGTGKTTVNATGTNIVTVDSTNSTAATTVNFSGSSANDVAIFTSLGQVSAAASLVGGSGTDVLKINNTNSETTNSDAALKSVGAGWSTLTFNGSGTGTGADNIALGTNFVNAGFKTVNGLLTGDTVTVTNATLNGVTFSGGVGTGMDTLVLNNAGGSATVVNFGVVNGSTAVDALTIGTTGTANTVIQLAVGSSVTDLNTNNSSLSVSGATSIIGNMGSETFTLLGQGTFATTVNSGGGNDVLVLRGNTSGVSVTTGGNTGVFSILGGISGSNLSSTYTITSAAAAGQYVTTNVETLTLAAGAGVTADMVFNNTVSSSVLYNYTLAGNDTAAFSIGTGTLGTGGYFGLTVNSGANDTVLINDSNWTGSATQSANVFINAGVANTVILGTNTTASSLVQEVGVNLTGLGASTNTSNGFVVTNWGSATDAIQLGGTGAFLASANQAATNSKTLLNSGSLNSSGVVTNTNSFSLGTTFVTGTSTQLANLASANSSGVTTNGGQIFDVQGNIGAGTNFASQAGINTAVSFITTNIGSATGGLVANQQAVLAVHDASSNTALFLFTNGAATSGILANELKLIGVVNNLASTSASSFN